MPRSKNILLSLFNILICVLIFVAIQFNCNNIPSGLISKKELHLSFPDIKTEIWSYSSCIYTNTDGKEYIAYASSKTKKLYLININNNNVDYIIELSKIASEFDFTYSRLKFFIHNLDSIFILPDEAKTIFLIGKSGDLIDEWNINLKTDKYDFVLSGFYTSPFAYYQNKIYVRFVPKIDPFKLKASYFSVSPELAIDIRNKNKIDRVGGWPEKYLKENYYDDYPFRYFQNNNDKVKLIYSYSAENDIYFFEGNNLIKKKIG